MQHYQDLRIKHQEHFQHFKKQFSIIAIVRLLLVLVILINIWQFIKNNESIHLIFALATLFVFVGLLQWHQKIKYKRNIQKKLVEINDDEIAYLNQSAIPFKDGKEYIDTTHLYTYDLDIFGLKSLFQHINRTATPIGEKTLAHKLSNSIETTAIVKHQLAIKELAQKIVFRQLFYAKAKLAKLDQEGYNKLINWSKAEVKIPSLILKITTFLMPALFFTMLLLAYFSNNILYAYLTNTVFLLNLCVFALNLKAIKNEMVAAEKIHETIMQYAQIFELIDKEEMHAEYLIELKKELVFEGEPAHLMFKKLSYYFSNLSSMQNPVGAVFFNGALLYHLGVYQNLLQWKNKHALFFEKYLSILGEFEALNSLANFSYNNKEFAFPAINNQFKINFRIADIH